MFLMETNKLDTHKEAEEKYGWFDLEEAISQMAVKEDKEFLEKIKNEI